LKGTKRRSLKNTLGRARAKRGNVLKAYPKKKGELEIGQVAARYHDIKPAGEIVKPMRNKSLEEAKTRVLSLRAYK